MSSSMCIRSSVAIIIAARPLPQYGQPAIPPIDDCNRNTSVLSRVRIAAYTDGSAMARPLCRCRLNSSILGQRVLISSSRRSTRCGMFQLIGSAMLTRLTLMPASDHSWY